MEHTFQVDLRGIISILSKNLYSGPEVFVRELLQNAVDAIRAREKQESNYEGAIHINIATDEQGIFLSFQDNGIGLTEDEVHRFLATIGQSSKRGEDARDFIGQFGIGLLSAFLVADKITVLSRSIIQGSPALCWHAQAQGTYSLEPTSKDIPIGSQVILRPNKDFQVFYEHKRIEELVKYFAAYLSYPIFLSTPEGKKHINDELAPWQKTFSTESERAEAFFDYGQEILGVRPFDVLDLHSEAGDVTGLAFILPWAPNLATKPKHKAYLKNMLISDAVDNLLPDWAFFVQCVMNAESLHPTASREAFVVDGAFEACRSDLGQQLKDYLKNLAQQQPQKLHDFITLHDLALKSLALQDDELFEIIIPWLTFESSIGKVKLLEDHKSGVIRYCTDLSQFRQLVRVAAAQGIIVINGSYVYISEILQKYAQVNPDVQLEHMDSMSITTSFQPLPLEERELCTPFLHSADEALKPFNCQVELAHFKPSELPTLYVLSEEQRFLRSVQQTQQGISDTLWFGVLEGLSNQQTSKAHLYLNMGNDLIRHLTLLRETGLIHRVMEVLYAQALLLGHHSLSAAEMQLLNKGILDLIDKSLKMSVNQAGDLYGAN